MQIFEHVEYNTNVCFLTKHTFEMLHILGICEAKCKSDLILTDTAYRLQVVKM
jgi:hypothetical protein